MATTKEIYTLRNNALYEATSISEALIRYENALLKLGGLENIYHANRLHEYKDEISNKKYRYKLQCYFNEIVKLINKDYPNTQFLVIGRIKSLISADDKIIKLLEENMSLDLFRDTYGFRVHIFGTNSLKLISKCYSIMNDIIKSFIEKGFTLCEADTVKDTNSFDASAHPSVLVPSKTGISEEFLYGVKDYIFTPKNNGYQSIHVVFRDSTGKCFEIQVRTLDMHMYAETGEASHSKFKSKRSSCPFDRTMIQLPAYRIAEDGTVFDFEGLEEAKEIFRRQP